MKHSELNTAEALHFAKVKTFTGSPTQIRPDFISQLLARADTRQLYLAIGSGLGQIVEIVAANSIEGQPATINTQELFAKILIANGEVLTTDQNIIYQD